MNVIVVYSKLQEVHNDLKSDIQVYIEMLEEDLGIEFDTKEKFKEMMRRLKE